MAEQDTHQHTADVKEGETQSTTTDHVPGSDEHKQEETDVTLNVKHSEEIFKQGSASSSASAIGDTNKDDGEDTKQADIKTEQEPVAEGFSSPDEVSRSSPPPNDGGGHGDYNRSTPRNEQLTITGEISREYHTGEKKGLKTTTSPTLHDKQYDQVDGPNTRLNEETPGTNNTLDTEAVEDADDGGGSAPQTDLTQEISDEEETDEKKKKVETIGATTQETTESTLPVDNGSPGGSSRCLVAVGKAAVIVAVVVAILAQYVLQRESPPQKNDVQQIDIFLRQMDKLKTQFPNQRAELWNRSKIHLLRHLQTAQPTEPVSLILTAGVRAEKTLRCLAKGLATAFSSPLNASVLHIDGASKASQDSDQVKLDIDSNLQGAFEGDKPVAVIHRFEELPPGSTLIFYRYCDHENAAYKKTCLIFTVLLGEEEEIPAKSRLSTVEEMVDDHLQKKFLSDSHPVSFDRMDLDKYGGLWSRISHLILPVTAEERIEHEGC